jgi:Tfp pilus assembly protein PilF
MNDRLQKLEQLLQRDPKDTFVLYGIAMEHKKAGRANEAADYFDRVLSIDPGYCYAYHQKGLLFESTGDMEAARRVYRQGIEAATKKGDAHAAEEIAAALGMIE